MIEDHRHISSLCSFLPNSLVFFFPLCQNPCPVVNPWKQLIRREHRKLMYAFWPLEKERKNAFMLLFIIWMASEFEPIDKKQNNACFL